MDLLPKSKSEFSQKDYWNTFFQKRGTKAFEWYGEYAELCGQLHKYIRTKDDILVVGCGNSTLSSDLHDVGHKRITNIDISQIVIRNMISINKTLRPDMKFLQMDATKMSFNDNDFSVIIDKGTLDALMPDDSEEVLGNIDKYFTEIKRILRLTGRYICVSLLQEHILKKIIETFSNTSWMLRVIRCHEAEGKNMQSGDGNSIPVFMIVATKFKQLPQCILEICLANDKMQRKTSNEICDIVKSIQDAAVVTNGIANSSLTNLNEVVMDLCKPGEESTRYTVFVQDQPPSRQNGKFACFIVPQGRESDWLFGTYEGRKQLLQSAKHNRLVVVTMHRGQDYRDWKTVKNELSACIRTLAPKGCSDQIPFLSLGADVGMREIRFKGVSEFSGEFVVEDVKVENENWFRRLIFLSNQFVVQSEAKLLEGTNSKGLRKVDHSYLACDHHTYMCVGVEMALRTQPSRKRNDSLSVMVVGLGGGGLCAFLQKYLKNVKLTAVEIDEAIYKVATDYFGLKVNDALAVHIEDGVNFIKQAANKVFISGTKYNAILFDVDSKDKSIGMSCPPQQFIDEEVLKAVSKCLGDSGYFLLNLVCRKEDLLHSVLKSLKKVFNHIAYYKLEEDINQIVYCTNNVDIDWRRDINDAADKLNTMLLKMKIVHDTFVNSSELTSSLTVLPSE